MFLRIVTWLGIYSPCKDKFALYVFQNKSLLEVACSAGSLTVIVGKKE